jgi:hypothetical protein
MSFNSPFWHWLFSQSHRRDNVGALARALVNDPIVDRVSPRRLHTLLTALEDRPDLRRWMRQSHAEWRKVSAEARETLGASSSGLQSTFLPPFTRDAPDHRRRPASLSVNPPREGDDVIKGLTRKGPITIHWDPGSCLNGANDGEWTVTGQYRLLEDGTFEMRNVKVTRANG